MSEEEIINIVENFLNYKIEKYLSGVEVCAISNLLDLYQKEKEKNKILEANGFRNGLYEVDGNYISKDKIKAKIEEVDNYGDTKTTSPPYYRTKKGAEIFKADAELILQELLEGD